MIYHYLDELRQAVHDMLLTLCPFLSKPIREKLAIAVSTMIQHPCVNLVEMANLMTHTAEDDKSRFQYLWRLFTSDRVDVEAIMLPFAKALLERMCANGSEPVLVIDQSQATKLFGHEVVMVSARVGKRGIPLFWYVEKTGGNIGWPRQRGVLEAVLRMLPAGVRPVLMADRFYSVSELIGWCRVHGWGWSLRCKDDMIVTDMNGGEITLRECVRNGDHFLEDVFLTQNPVKTNIGIIHEKGHKEPWIIAMDRKPNEYTTLDYGMRWSIEALFSDLKSRGFNLTESRIEHDERVSRLIMVASLATHFCVSTGMWHAEHKPTKGEKKLKKRKAARKKPPRNLLWSMLSLFKRGLRWLERWAKLGLNDPLPGLWQEWVPEYGLSGPDPT